MIFAISLFIILVALVIVLNTKFIRLNFVMNKNSLLESQTMSIQQSVSVFDCLFEFIGKYYVKLLPSEFLESFICKLRQLEKEDSLDLIFGQAAVILLLGLSYLLCSGNLLALLFVILSQLIFLFSVDWQIQKINTEIENNIDHVVKCLKVLVVQSETPIINALSLIEKDLELEHRFIKRELQNLIAKAQKLGINKALEEWHTELFWYRDFTALLVSINQGSSKKAIEQNIDNFLHKIFEFKAENEKAKVENLQLLFMGPVVLMLLVSMYPMMDAVQFLMQGSSVNG